MFAWKRRDDAASLSLADGADDTVQRPGDMITENDIHLLSPGDGFKWADRNKVIGHRVLKEIPRNEIIYPSLIEE